MSFKLILPTLKSILVKAILLVVFFVLGHSIQAQQIQGNKNWEWINTTVVESPFKYSGRVLGYNQSLEKSVRNFIKSNYKVLNNERTALKLIAKRESQIGSHFLFRQVFLGVEIYGTEIKVSLRKDGRIASCFVTVVNTKNWERNLIEISNKPVTNAKPVIFYDINEVSGAWYYEKHDDQSNSHFKVVQKENGEAFLNQIDRKRHGGPKDTTVWVYVFNPDPLTTAGVVYGGNYINANDADNEELNAERQLLPVKMKYLADSIWAENKYVKLVSEDVNVDVPYSRTDTFNYTRGQDEFEFVMTLYHISNFKDYLNSIGFDSLMNYQIKVKPRAFREDNSNFRRIFNGEGEGTLNFGYSDNGLEHVDDAEDADVIIHEYGHALSYHTNLNELDGAARRALDEGVCDYFAASYSKEINDFRYTEVYSWDGHNPFWDGRSTNTDNTFNDFDANKTIWENGEILASVLIEINNEIGREATDVILINSLYEYADRMSFKASAELFIEAELEIYKGQYHDIICEIFKNHEFIDDEYCETGISTPNDKNDFVQIDKTAFSNNGVLQVKFNKEFTGVVSIYDASGKLVKAKTVSQAKSVNSQMHLKPGVYLVVFNNGWELYTEKLIK